MNNVFDTRRFFLLFRKTVLERPMQLIGFTVLMLSIVFIIYAFFKSMGAIPEGQNASFMFGFAGGGCFLGAIIFGYFNTNAKGAAYLLLPASQFEKWLVSVLITGVFYTLIFLLFYRLMDSFFVDAYHKKLDPKSIYYTELRDEMQILPFDGFVFKTTLMMYLNFTGATMLGALFFNKASFLKVALIFCGLLFFSYFLNIIVAKMMMSGVQNAMPYLWTWIRINDAEGRIEMNTVVLNVWQYCAFILVPFILWVLAFVRLREKEF